MFIAGLTDGTSEYAITVYHERYSVNEAGVPVEPVDPCTRDNPSCCEFGLRIKDVEDPALMYPPYGANQYMSRCQDVQECDACSYEEKPPSVSSDRVCTAFEECDPNCQFQTDTPPGPFTPRTCQTLAYCDPVSLSHSGAPERCLRH